jgi:hypothetical protein
MPQLFNEFLGVPQEIFFHDPSVTFFRFEGLYAYVGRMAKCSMLFSARYEQVQALMKD